MVRSKAQYVSAEACSERRARTSAHQTADLADLADDDEHGVGVVMHEDLRPRACACACACVIATATATATANVRGGPAHPQRQCLDGSSTPQPLHLGLGHLLPQPHPRRPGSASACERTRSWRRLHVAIAVALALDIRGSPGTRGSGSLGGMWSREKKQAHHAGPVRSALAWISSCAGCACACASSCAQISSDARLSSTKAPAPPRPGRNVQTHRPTPPAPSFLHRHVGTGPPLALAQRSAALPLASEQPVYCAID